MIRGCQKYANIVIYEEEKSVPKELIFPETKKKLDKERVS